MDVVIAAAIKSLSKIPIDNRELAWRSVETVTRVTRNAPVIKTGLRIGSSYQGNTLIQDAIGNAACKFFARHLEQEYAITFIEEQLVAGTEQSSFRLRQLPSEAEFVAKLKQEVRLWVESINDWPATALQEHQRSCAHEFLRMCVFDLKSEEFQAAAEEAMKALKPEKQEK